VIGCASAVQRQHRERHNLTHGSLAGKDPKKASVAQSPSDSAAAPGFLQLEAVINNQCERLCERGYVVRLRIFKL
jgi:hypothetical protein